MKLESLYVHSSYNKTAPYSCSVTMSGNNGKIELSLGDELSRRILEVCADEIVMAAKAAAETITASIIEAVAEPKMLGTDNA